MPLDTDGSSIGSKEGEASAYSLLGWITMGDASVRTAAAQGDIKEVTSVDYEKVNLLGIYARFTVLVTGN
jgi:hypothetical protein